MKRCALLLIVCCVSGCATPVSFVPPHDANADVWRDPSAPHWIGRLNGGSGSDGGSTHDTGPTSSCAARILVVFDRSLSMQMVWTGTSTSGPRWQIAETAIAGAIRAHETQLSAGAILFPSSEGSPMGGPACAAVDTIDRQIPFVRGPDFLSRWSATWSAPLLLGTTPIDAAFESADLALAGAHAETAVVLLTDGEPTCTGAISAGSYAATWHTRGIQTWVVGLPGSEAGVAYLSAIANAGGTSAPLSVDDPSTLSAALAGIAGAQVESQCGH